MEKFVWIAVLKKAKELAEGKDDSCSRMFGYLLEAMETTPVRSYRCGDRVTEEEEEE